MSQILWNFPEQIIPMRVAYPLELPRCRMVLPVPPQGRHVTRGRAEGASLTRPGPSESPSLPLQHTHVPFPINRLFPGEIDAVNISFQNDILASPVNQGD